MKAGPDVTVGSQSLKVSQMKTAFDVQTSSHKMERRSSPKKGKTGFQAHCVPSFHKVYN